MFLVNSRLSSLTAPRIAAGRAYSEVTPVNLPSSLIMVISYTLGFSPHPPESVYGTVTHIHNNTSFLDTLSPKIRSTRRLRFFIPNLIGTNIYSRNMLPVSRCVNVRIIRA